MLNFSLGVNTRAKVFTWHIHGSYLFYLSQGEYDIYIPVKEDRSEGYVGRGQTFPFGINVIEVPVQHVKELDLDLILFQTENNYLKDQYEVLSEEQRNLPKVFLEHDPPWAHPTDEIHPVQDPTVTIVHVTQFNALMWDCGNCPTKVIEHGVMPQPHRYSGELERGLVVINNLPARGRMLGFDLFERVKKEVPIDLIGMGTGAYGIGEVLHPELPEFISRYRFFFNPIRYTSLGLAICEAMMLGMPVVGLATTELSVTIQNGINGFIDTDVDKLVGSMKGLLENPTRAIEIGKRAKETAEERFHIKRFIQEWKLLFEEVMAKYQPQNYSNYEE